MEEDRPIEILPWGRTLEQQNKIDAKKAQARNGLAGCLFYLVAFALIAVYCAGWAAGRHS